MIDEIRVEGIGVISRATIPLTPGLTAITGETGAGKTMLLTGLSLLLGGRADPAAVRTGHDQATVEGAFVVDPASPVAERVRDAGGVVDDDGGLVALRTLPAAGRSRAFLGGRSVPQAVLGELADHLVTVHGQADQMRLRAPARQREALDDFAGPEHLRDVEEHRRQWAGRRRLEAELDELVRTARDRTREAELLRVGLEELERVDPQPGEDAALAAEAERLGNVEDLREASAVAHAALEGDDADPTAPGALGAVERARRALEPVAEHDEALAGLLGRVAEVSYLVADVTTELSAYVADLQADPARLDAVQQRRAELAGLARTRGTTVEELLPWGQEASSRLLELDGTDSRVEQVRERLAEAERTVSALAATIGGRRRTAAALLAEAVTAELAGLAMGGASLQVDVTSAEHGPSGADDVVLLLVPHPGAPPRPLGQGASGGELSRVMLALEVALATSPGSRAHTPGTFVFDEVDAGVGGRAAVEVGRRLAELALRTQVVVVTHLAQVAAFADHHLVVSKTRADGADGQDEVTVSDVRAVQDEQRVAELARMLSGQDDSTTALEHAAELLARSVVGR